MAEGQLTESAFQQKHATRYRSLQDFSIPMRRAAHANWASTAKSLDLFDVLKVKRFLTGLNFVYEKEAHHSIRFS